MNDIFKNIFSSKTSPDVVTPSIVPLTAPVSNEVSSPSQQPTQCRRAVKGCNNLVTVYTDTNTALCPTCDLQMKNLIESSPPPPPTLCPCCQASSNSSPFSFCENCWRLLEDDGQVESEWGCWALDSVAEEVVCIDWVNVKFVIPIFQNM